VEYSRTSAATCAGASMQEGDMTSPRATQLLVCLLILTSAPSCCLVGSARPDMDPRHKALLMVRKEMCEEDVVRILGPPDEVRHVQEHLLDGVSYGAEAYRWVYGNRLAGTFARVGIVSFNRDGLVVRARSPVYRQGYSYRARPTMLSEKRLLVSPEGLSCHIGAVSRDLCTRITVKNGGKKDYARKGISDLGSKTTVEVYDEDRSLIFRENHRFYRSGFLVVEGQPYKGRWFRIPAGQSKADGTGANVDMYFGVLPPGRYFLRACFPYDTDKFITSNAVEFVVPEPSKEVDVPAKGSPEWKHLGHPFVRDTTGPTDLRRISGSFFYANRGQLDTV